jgi:hypothetical protein
VEDDHAGAAGTVRRAFGEQTNANNKSWLLKRIIWRLHVLAEGDLSERARRRATELANDADLRLSPPKAKDAPVAEGSRTVTIPLPNGDRIPPAGSIISRTYKGATLQVRILDGGFEFEGEVYRSLSAVAKQATGQHPNGFAFFRLGQEAAS